jgi:hypothetical protein
MGFSRSGTGDARALDSTERKALRPDSLPARFDLFLLPVPRSTRASRRLVCPDRVSRGQVLQRGPTSLPSSTRPRPYVPARHPHLQAARSYALRSAGSDGRHPASSASALNRHPTAFCPDKEKLRQLVVREPSVRLHPACILFVVVAHRVCTGAQSSTLDSASTLHTIRTPFARGICQTC